MNISDLSRADIIGFSISFLLTLLVFSYLIGDNPLFRLAISLFVGVTTGYAAVVAFYSVIMPRLFLPIRGGMGSGEQVLSLVPLALGTLMLLKLSPGLAKWGNFAMAYLVGVGAASAIGGAINGTLFPQVGASINLFDRQASAAVGADLWIHFLNAGLLLVGTIATLAYFHFSIRPRAERPSQRSAWIEQLGRLGQIFIAIAFGTLFAGVYAASMAALVERLRFVVDFVKALIVPLLQ